MNAWVAAVALAAASGEPTLTWTPRQAVLGETARLRLRIRVPGAPADVAAPRLRSTEGTLGELARVGPGEWSTTLDLPEGGPPLLAIVTAVREEQGRGADVAFAAIPLRGRAAVPVETEPGARIEVLIGGETLGPFRADERGRLEVSVAVPPGVTSARVRAAAPGGRTDRVVQLGVPPPARVAVEAVPGEPGRLRIEVFVAGGARSGEVVLEADGARLSGVEPVAGRPDRFLATAEGPPGPVRIRAWLRGEVDLRDEILSRIAPPAAPSAAAPTPPEAAGRAAGGEEVQADAARPPPPPAVSLGAGYRARAGTAGGAEMAASMAWPLAARGRLVVGLGALAFAHGAGPAGGARVLEAGLAPEAVARLVFPGAALAAAVGPAAGLACAFRAGAADGCAARVAISLRLGFSWKLASGPGWLLAEWGIRWPLGGRGFPERSLLGGPGVLVGLSFDRP